MHFISGAHNDALMIGLIAAGFALVVRKHPYVGVLLITMGAAIKPIGLVALPFAGLLWAGQGAPMMLVARRWVQSAAVAITVMVGLQLSQERDLAGSMRSPLPPRSRPGCRLRLPPEWPSGAVVDVGDSTQPTPSFRFFAFWQLSLRWHLSPISACVPALVIPCVRQAWRSSPRRARSGGAALVLAVVSPLLAATALTKIETKRMIYGTVGLTLFSLVSHFM